MDWISIEDQEPELHVLIRVKTEKGTIVGQYAGDRRLRNIGAGFTADDYRDFIIQSWKPEN